MERMYTFDVFVSFLDEQILFNISENNVEICKFRVNGLVNDFFKVPTNQSYNTIIDEACTALENGDSYTLTFPYLSNEFRISYASTKSELRFEFNTEYGHTVQSFTTTKTCVSQLGNVLRKLIIHREIIEESIKENDT